MPNRLTSIFLFFLMVAVGLSPASGDVVRVAVCQMMPVAGDVQGNLAKAESFIQRAAAAGAKICVLPELADVGFYGRKPIARQARPVPGPTTDALGAIARKYGVWIATALCEDVPTGGTFDTTVLIDSQGQVVLRIRKQWTYASFGGERSYQGNYQDAYPADTPWGPIGVMNCVEVNIPGARQFWAAHKPVLMLVPYANPGAGHLLDRTKDLAELCASPVVATNHVFPAGTRGGKGGKSRFVAANGAVLWMAPAGVEIMKVWDIEVNPPSHLPPRVDAGSVQTIRLPVAQVTLSGYAVDDGKPNPILATRWSKVSGPGTVRFGNPRNLTTTATFSTSGVYRLKLTADDGGTPVSEIVSINVLPAGTGDVSLVGYWPFDGTYQDLSGNAHHGTPRKNPSFSADVAPTGGANSKSLNLKGSSYVKVAHAPALNAPHAATVALWFKARSRPRRGGGATLLGKGHSYFFQYNYMLLQARAYWLLAEGMDGMRIASLSDRASSLGVWHHAAVVYDADKRHGKIYINGVLDHTVRNAPSRNPVNRYPVLIGVRQEDVKECFNGCIDDVRLYTRALTDEEIAGLVPGAVVNAPPTLSAGPNQTISQAMTAQLRGTYQDDHRPDTSSIASWVQWRKVSGPGDVVFANRFALETQVRFSQPGVYLLELHGSDGGHNVFSTVTITVET